MGFAVAKMCSTSPRRFPRFEEGSKLARDQDLEC
jgi:hypothetical protein